jgi:hypothetical protein
MFIVTLDAVVNGSDEAIRWLACRSIHGEGIAPIFDPNGLSQHLVVGATYDVLLHLGDAMPNVPTYGAFTLPHSDWIANIESLHMPQRDFDAGQLPANVHSNVKHQPPTGPTYVLLAHPSGRIAARMGQLYRLGYYRPLVGQSVTIPGNRHFQLMRVIERKR